ncbi:sensor histidine kinase [Faecalicatena contorta]|uniref:sensor histidine kinase n=1 Tax=Faecalicatena contorta TaxID=39482 RepID=UPI001F25EFEE|nr:sensor histidine kinase [Faecalicatena contorta]MCF2682694.1 sensor histidine kinase [Faecalicatena contorta]
MDTKLKNRHKLAVVLMIVTIIAASVVMMSPYSVWYAQSQKLMESSSRSAATSTDFLVRFIEASYILYNQETEREDIDQEEIRTWLEENITYELDQFDYLYPYLDYQVRGEEGKIIAKSVVESGQSLSENNLNSYAIGMIVTYDKYGTPEVVIKKSDYKKEQTTYLREILNHFDENHEEWKDILQTPKNRTYIFAMTKENMETYLADWYYYEAAVPDQMYNYMLILMLAVAILAWIYPMIPSLQTGRETIFQARFEVVAVLFFVVFGIVVNQCEWLLYRNKGVINMLDVAVWILVFTVTYWAASCVRQIYVLGVRTYMKERTLFCPLWHYAKKAARFIADTGKRWFRKGYESVMSIDFSQKNNRMILTIVLWNFILLSLICCMWFFGIMALIIYSVILFFILRKFYGDLQKKYAVLLKATEEIAGGNLDLEITEDLGIFEPFKTEIGKIQTGFKKAVDEEVKSQRMKTELITNVSHDLKTPLTAIITYVNLLKEETDPQNQKEYIDVLDRKSMRLKALIEDLFEISKASSKNVTLDITDVDIVNLFKQVKLELEDKITKADLEFRCTYDPEKIIVSLDSQKTYRIFENLLINIVKYALPHTRVYVDICREGEETVVRMKNVSAKELDFNPEEITERFVRGDSSRNTEGSGLGLAIVKSFVELQKGKLRIETEADLFKVEIRWK